MVGWFDGFDPSPYAVRAMLDQYLRRSIEPLLTAPAGRIAAFGISADSITAAGFVLGIAALPDIGHRDYLVGLGFIALSRLFDIADGAVARIKGPTAFGAYLAQVLDLVWTAGIPFAFALGQPDRSLAAMFLMIGLVTRAAVLTADVRVKDGTLGTVLGLGGDLVGKTEIFAAFALACVFPDWFSIMAYVLGMLCFVMAGFRVAAAAQQQ